MTDTSTYGYDLLGSRIDPAPPRRVRYRLGFFDLPGEIRNIIYELVADEAHSVLKQGDALALDEREASFRFVLYELARNQLLAHEHNMNRRELFFALCPQSHLADTDVNLINIDRLTLYYVRNFRHIFRSGDPSCCFHYNTAARKHENFRRRYAWPRSSPVADALSLMDTCRSTRDEMGSILFEEFYLNLVPRPGNQDWLRSRPDMTYSFRQVSLSTPARVFDHEFEPRMKNDKLYWNTSRLLEMLILKCPQLRVLEIRVEDPWSTELRHWLWVTEDSDLEIQRFSWMDPLFTREALHGREPTREELFEIERVYRPITGQLRLPNVFRRAVQRSSTLKSRVCLWPVLARTIDEREEQKKVFAQDMLRYLERSTNRHLEIRLVGRTDIKWMKAVAELTDAPVKAKITPGGDYWQSVQPSKRARLPQPVWSPQP